MFWITLANIYNRFEGTKVRALQSFRVTDDTVLIKALKKNAE